MKFEDNISKRDIISRRTSEPERGLSIHNPVINYSTTQKPLIIKVSINLRADGQLIDMTITGLYKRSLFFFRVKK